MEYHCLCLQQKTGVDMGTTHGKGEMRGSDSDILVNYKLNILPCCG